MKKPKKARWKQDPEAVRTDILAAATKEFAAHGLSGARVDRIAGQTHVSKRMIYYYFGGKAGLYRAVLEAAYARVRSGEAALDLADLDPATALTRIAEFTFDFHRANPDFIRLVMIENIHGAKHLKASSSIRKLNETAISKLKEVCDRGKALGVFRADIEPLDLHWIISAFSVFNVANRATFSASFGTAFLSEDAQASLKRRSAGLALAAALK